MMNHHPNIFSDNNISILRTITKNEDNGWEQSQNITKKTVKMK